MSLKYTFQHGGDGRRDGARPPQQKEGNALPLLYKYTLLRISSIQIGRTL